MLTAGKSQEQNFNFHFFMNSKATVDRDRRMSGDLVSNRALFSH